MKKPPIKLIRLCKRLHIKLSIYRNGRRVPKPISLLKRQIRNKLKNKKNKFKFGSIFKSIKNKVSSVAKAAKETAKAVVKSAKETAKEVNKPEKEVNKPEKEVKKPEKEVNKPEKEVKNVNINLKKIQTNLMNSFTPTTHESDKIDFSGSIFNVHINNPKYTPLKEPYKSFNQYIELAAYTKQKKASMNTFFMNQLYNTPLEEKLNRINFLLQKLNEVKESTENSINTVNDNYNNKKSEDPSGFQQALVDLS
jgi:type I site-specific restriction endonuclease